MTDFLAQSQAAALQRLIDARIDQKIAIAQKLPTGITPGTAYGSVIFDTAGRAVWGGAGGGAAEPPFARVRSIAGQTVVADTAERVELDFSSLVYGTALSTFSSGGIKIGLRMNSMGLYYFVGSVGWANADTGWRYLTLAEENTNMDGGFSIFHTSSLYAGASAIRNYGQIVGGLVLVTTTGTFASLWVESSVNTGLEMPEGARPGTQDGWIQLLGVYLGQPPGS